MHGFLLSGSGIFRVSAQGLVKDTAERDRNTFPKTTTTSARSLLEVHSGSDAHTRTRQTLV